jgi:YD repeat-containing protein
MLVILQTLFLARAFGLQPRRFTLTGPRWLAALAVNPGPVAVASPSWLVALLMLLAYSLAQGQGVTAYQQPIPIYVDQVHAPARFFSSWNEACSSAGPGCYVAGQAIICMGNPRGGKSAGQQGCYYHYTYDLGGTILSNEPDFFVAGWAIPIATCPDTTWSYVDAQEICKKTIPYTKNDTCPEQNPVYPADGSKRQAQQDFEFSAFGRSRQFGRTFFSDSLTGFGSRFGWGWLPEPWGRSLQEAGAELLLATRGAGKTTFLRRAADGVYRANPFDGLESRRTPSGWELTDQFERSIESYSAEGRLLAIASADGAVVNLSYSTRSTPGAVAPVPGLLIGIDANARQVGIAYDPLGRLKSANLVGAPALNYSFDPTNNWLLAAVKYADQTQTKYHYEESLNPQLANWSALADINNLARMGQVNSLDIDVVVPRAAVAQARAGRSNLFAMTGVTDELDARYATYTYDSTGRVLRTAHGALPGTRFVYDIPLQQTTMIDALGTATKFSMSAVAGVLKGSGRDQAAGSGCAASVATVGHDPIGNRVFETDFNGNRTCYFSNLDRNIETVRVEGLANVEVCSPNYQGASAIPAGGRKTSTQWHPDWVVKTAVAEPGKLTTSIYNGQPDPFAANASALCAPINALLPNGKPIAVLCKQVEQATTDADGGLGFAAPLQSGVPARVQSWNYNQFGQVLTAKGARTDVNDTTTYAYYPDTAYAGTDPNAYGHSIGDVYTMTNALGQTTTYTKYNKHGQLLEMVDANSVVTSNTYDLRQRLTSTSVGGQVTIYDYWPTSLLKKVTQPDGSFVSYEYDAAHRQTAAQDNLGNRIDYILDNAGNRTGEETKDPAGLLRRALTRSIDALGRVQQVTGRE